MKLEFRVYVLVKRRFTKPIQEFYHIYYSKFFRRFVTFSPAIRNLRHSVQKVVEFGDLSLTPELNKKCERLTGRKK